MTSMDPQGQNQPPYDPSQGQPQNGAPFNAMPSYSAAPGQPAPEMPKKRGKGKFIALGCGILALIFIVFVGGCAALLSAGSNSEDAAPAQTATEPEAAPSEDAPADESAVDEAAVEEEAPAEEAPAEDAPAPKADVPADHASALTSAETYSDMMHMSKQGIFDQLTSESGDQFTADEAQYAIDNIDADWNKNALESAKLYQDEMAMSPDAIHDQLTSDYGDQFTLEQADYAIANLNG